MITQSAPKLKAQDGITDLPDKLDPDANVLDLLPFGQIEADGTGHCLAFARAITVEAKRGGRVLLIRNLDLAEERGLKR